MNEGKAVQNEKKEASCRIRASLEHRTLRDESFHFKLENEARLIKKKLTFLA